MSFIYIASPYTHKLQEVVDRRFKAAEDFTAMCLMKGMHVYSPIVHCHELAAKYDLPHDFDYWGSYNRAMLCKASKMIVMRIDGWECSKGVQSEIEFAKQCGIEVEYE